MSSKEFKETLSALPLNQETFVLILNVHALNMTLNWLCNTEQIPGVHEQSLIVTMDRAAADALKELWPNIRQLHWSVPGLQKPFNYGDGPYQLFYLFRANLARALIAMGKPFWMIQQDTFWAESLSSFNVAARTEDIIFDRASENGPMIAGKRLFTLLIFDNTMTTSFSLITNWQWLDSKCSNSSPSFVQFDGETNLGGKLGKMKQLGFYFLQEDGRSCNRRAVQEARQLLNQRMSNWSQLASSSQQQFKFYQNVIDWMYGNPWTSWFLNRWMLPYGHYCMLSF
ncbi:hypothetical protein ANCCAN_14550 [Ancylostoma caninum]|uniref:Nucleotide-diphospho-sugar transferase domain-containing protein n=1 Tax=Ancylostoma caninum TaxID=29170 RepID=A0A368G592_ANCCA|nr:hypothetical protein ANCCAN_14550 [Ancylostoma caninum]